MKKKIAKSIFVTFGVFVLALFLAVYLFTVSVVDFTSPSDREAEAVTYTTSGTAVGSADALKNICRANQSGTYYLSSNITWSGASYNQSYTFSGTLYGNGKTITISTGNTSQTTVGDNVDIGMLFSVLSGTIRDCTIVVNDATYWYEYTGSKNNYTDYAGIICGKLNGGTINNVTISIANGKGLSFYAEDKSSSAGGGYGCIVGAYAGRTAGTSTIKNCTLINNGGIWGKSEDFDGNGDEGTASRCHVGGFVGEATSTLNMYNNRLQGATTGVIGSGLINSESAHRAGRTGGIIGVIRSGATCTIDGLLFEFQGRIHCFRDRNTKCGLLVGYNYGTCTAKNIVVPSNITTYRQEGNEGSKGNPASCFSSGSLTDVATPASHSGAMGSGAAKAGSNVNLSNSITYSVNAYLGSSASSSYGTFSVEPYIDASGSTGSWNVTVSPASSYCVSDVQYGSSYKNAYTTKRNNGSAYTTKVSSSSSSYAGYVAQQGNSVTYTNSGKSGAYDGAGWGVQAQVTIGSSKYTCNYCPSTAYYHSQNASGGAVTATLLSSSDSKGLTNKNVGEYTLAIRTGQSANASLLASNTCIYRDAANAPSKVGYYNGQTATCSITKRELSLTITNNINSEYVGQETKNIRSKIYITNLVGSEALRFFVSKKAKTYSSSSGSNWEENTIDCSSYGFSSAGDYWHRTNNTYIYFTALDAGSYSFKILGIADATDSSGGIASNYTWSSSYDTEAERTTSFTINKKALSVTKTTTGQSYTYNGDRVAANWENRAALTVNNLVAGDTVYFWFNDYSTVGLDNTVYFIRNNDTAQKYNYPLNHGYTDKISGKTCGDYYTLSSAASTLYFCAKNAGTYTIVLYGMTQGNNSTAPTNYTWASDSDTDSERTITFTVNPKELSLTSATNQSSLTYRGTPAKANFSSEYAVSWKVSGLVGSEYLCFRAKYQSGLWIDASTNGSYLNKLTETDGFNRNNGSFTYFTADNAGTYSATIYDFIDDQDTGHSSEKFGYAKNYKWSASYDTEAERTVTFTIVPKEVTLSWSNTSFTYDKSSHVPTCTAGSLLSGESCGVTVTGAQTNAGSHTATASSLSNANYKLPSSKTQSFTIAQKTVSLTWGTTAFTYSGTSQTPTCTAGSLCSGDSCTVTVTGGQTNAGNYTATASSLSNGNYALPSSKTQAFTINPKAITLTVTNDMDATYVGQSTKNVRGKVVVGGLVGSEILVFYISKQAKTYDAREDYVWEENNIDCTNYGNASAGDYWHLGNQTLYFSAVDAGSYSIKVLAFGNNLNDASIGKAANYTWASSCDTEAERTITFSISPKEVGLSWGTTTFTYDKTAKKPTCSATNVCSGDTCTVTVTGEKTDAGSYTATASSLSNANYVLPSAKTTSFTIQAKEVGLTWGTATFTYDKTAKKPTCVADSLCSGDTCTVTVTGEKTDVGNYTATASGLSNANYALPSAHTKDFSITPKEATLSWGANSFIYNAAAQKPSCTVTNLCDGDTCTVTVSGEKTNVGENYTATATALSNGNYKLPASVTQTFSVTQKEVTLSWGSTAFTYDKTAKIPSCTAGNVCSGDTCTVTLSGEQTNVGSYTATATALSDGNYKLPTTVTKDFTIAQKEVTLSWGNTTFTYDKTAKLPTCTAGSLCSGDSCNVTVTGSQTDAGSYTATASELDNGNYTLPTFCQQNFTVNKANYDMTGVSFESKTFEYDGNVHSLVLSGTLPTGLDDSKVTVSYDGSATDVDDGIVTVTASFGTESQNYNVPESKTATVQILAKEIVIDWCEDDFTYNGETQTPTATFTSVQGDSVSLTVSFEVAFKAYLEGGYTATASFATSDNNYKLPQTVTHAYTMKRKSVQGAEITLGNSLTYTGSEQTQTVSKVLIDSLVATFDVSDNVQTEAGTYTLTVTGKGNFSGTETKEYTVAKKTVTVTAKGVEITYGDDVKNNGVRINGLIGEESLEGTVDYDYGYERYGNIGKYALTPKGLSSKNYSISYVAGDFTVVQKVISVIITPNGGTYGNVVESTACFGEGCIENNDDVAILITYFGTTVAGEDYPESSTVPADAGSYTVRAKIGTEGKAANYLLPSTVSQFIITKADFNIQDIISFVGGQFDYDAQEHSLAVTFKQETEITVTYENNGRTDVGSQEVTASFSGYDLSNYNEIEAMNATLTITACSIAEAVVTLGDGLTYNGKAQTQTVLSVAVGELLATYDVTDDVETNAGFYTLKLTGNGNFTGSTEADFTIEAFDVTDGVLTLGDTLTYNGTQQTQEVLKVEKGGLSATFTVTGNVQTDVGKEDYVLTVVADGNYTGTLTQTWNILPKDVSKCEITLGEELIYNGVKQKQTIVSAVIDGLDVTYEISDNEYKDAGDYVLTITAQGNFTGSKQKQFTVRRKDLTITAIDKTIVYGREPACDGVEFEGFVIGENQEVLQGEPTISFDYTQYGKIGTYTITPAGYESNNYAVTFVQGVLTVEPFVTTLTWDEKVLRYNGKAQLPVCTIFVYNDDSCNLVLSGKGTTVGNYTASVLSLSNANYALPTVRTHDYAILPCFVTKPTASTETYTYSGKEITYTFSKNTDKERYTVTSDKRTQAGSQCVVVSLIDNVNYYWDDESYNDLEYNFTVQKLVLTEPSLQDLYYTGSLLTPTLSDSYLGKYYGITENNGGIDVGSYGVTLTLYSEDCAWKNTDAPSAVLSYSILQAKNTWTKEPKIASITYGESLLPTALSLFGSVRYLYKKADTEEEFTETEPTHAGTYTILYSVNGTANYTGIEKQLSFIIKKASFDLSALAWTTDTLFTFDGERKSVSVSGIPDGVTATYANNEKTHAGKYTASVAFDYDKGNYNEVRLADLSWEIQPKAVTAVWEEKSFLYDGTVFDLPRAYYRDGEEERELLVSESDGKTFCGAGLYTFVATHENTDFAVEKSSAKKYYKVDRKEVQKPAGDDTVFSCTGAEQIYTVAVGEGYTVKNNVRTEAGSQEVVVSLADGNYVWSDNTTDDVTFTFTVAHGFSEHNGDATRLLHEATCTESAIYTAVCVCGEIEEYSFANPLGHDYKAAFTWQRDYTAQVEITCSRCDFVTEKTPEIRSEDEDVFTYYYASVTIEGKSFTDRKMKGAATYEGNVYDEPVWTWLTTKKGEYSAEASFTALRYPELVQTVNAVITYEDAEKSFTMTASVVFGDEKRTFTADRTVEKIPVTVYWNAENVAVAYYRPCVLAGETLGEIPEDERELLGFNTESGVFFPYKDGTVPEYYFTHAETLTAVYRSIGNVTVTAVDESGNKLTDIFLTMTNDDGTKYEGSILDEQPLSFKKVPYGLYTLKASFTLDNKQIERNFTVEVDGKNVEKEVVLVQKSVNTQINGQARSDDLEQFAAETESNQTTTVILTTSEETEESVKELLNKRVSEEKYDQELSRFYDISLTQKVETVDENGKVSEETKSLNALEEPITIKLEVPDDVYEGLIQRNGTTDDIVIYLYDNEGETSVKLPKQEFAHSEKQFFSIQTTGSKTYVLLTVQSFGTLAIGIQTKVVQEVNEFLSLSIQNWVYGTSANAPESDAKYGTVKYLYAKKNESTYSEIVPTHAGTYVMKAYVEAEEEYTGIEQTVEFTIDKATYNLDKVFLNDKTYPCDGSEYSVAVKGELPEGVYVEYESNGFSEIGKYTVVAHFYGDEENYNLIPDKTATLTIEDQYLYILRTYWWAFAFGGITFVSIFLSFILRSAGANAVEKSPFDYRIG